MSNFCRKNKQNNGQYNEIYGGLSPIRRRNGDQGAASIFRMSNNYYSGMQNHGRSPIRQRYQEQRSSQYDSCYNYNNINKSPIRNRTPIRGAKSPICSTTPNRQASPIRARTPVRTPKKDIKTQYISNVGNQFQRNPQSIKMNQAGRNSDTGLINTHSHNRIKGGLFNQMISNICSKGKENYTVQYQSSYYSNCINDQEIQRRQFEKRIGGKISFSGLSQQHIQQIESVQYYERNIEFCQGSYVRNHQKNIPLLVNMSPLTGVRKNLNSHRQYEAKPKMGRKISDHQHLYKQELPFKLFSMQPGQIAIDQSPVKNQYGQKDGFNSPITQNQSNNQSPNDQGCSFQNSTMKKSVKPVSLFNQLIQSFRCEKPITQKQNRGRDNNGIKFATMKKNSNQASEVIDFKNLKVEKAAEIEKKPQIFDSIQFLLQKVNEKPMNVQSDHQWSGIDVKNSQNFNQESLNMDAYL